MKRFPLILFISTGLTFAMAQTPTPNPAGNSGAAKSSANAGKSQPAASGNADVTSVDSNLGDPLLDVPPLPKGQVTLIGGTVSKIDTIRDRLQVDPFGDGKKMKIYFDERTHVFHDGTETTQANIHKGDRVYVDTMLDGPHVFARNIRVITQLTRADASGQILAYNPQNGVMELEDQLSAQPVMLSVNPQTIIKRKDQSSVAAADIKPGSLVTVKFTSNGRRQVAQEIGIIATPGTQFTFAGKVMHLDMRSGSISIHNQSDDKTYDIQYDSAQTPLSDGLTVGSQITVVATFTGKGYKANKIEME